MVSQIPGIAHPGVFAVNCEKCGALVPDPDGGMQRKIDWHNANFEKTYFVCVRCYIKGRPQWPEES